jgi:hypothetical protein
VNMVARALSLYGIRIEKYTLAEFEAGIQKFKDSALQAVSYNYIYSGEHVSELIKLPDNIKNGAMDAAIQIECSKYLLETAPTLMSGIILDIKRDFFDA